MIKELPSMYILSLLLDYNMRTGDLVWKIRERNLFKSYRECTRWNNRFSGEIAGWIEASTGYRVISIFDVPYLAHRIAYKIVLGYEPPALLDHKNRIVSDNRWFNIRPANTSYNQANRKDRETLSGYRGVRIEGNFFRAYIYDNGKYTNLGSFTSAPEAYAAYCEAAKAVYGEFASQSTGD